MCDTIIDSKNGGEASRVMVRSVPAPSAVKTTKAKRYGLSTPSASRPSARHSLAVIASLPSMASHRLRAEISEAAAPRAPPWRWMAASTPPIHVESSCTGTNNSLSGNLSGAARVTRSSCRISWPFLSFSARPPNATLPTYRNRPGDDEASSVNGFSPSSSMPVDNGTVDNALLEPTALATVGLPTTARLCGLARPLTTSSIVMPSM
mmetsp:Transcript_1724/g.4308  ORF Transcript_1724/g.4308 Transcript_1724/m.4308 type:complete len:207 (-) Transcript_1724:184-804(-)